jgi:hypothetical protein
VACPTVEAPAVEQERRQDRAPAISPMRLQSLRKCAAAPRTVAQCLTISPDVSLNPSEPAMSKEQRASKNTKKPKKDAAPPKPAGSDRPTPPVTSVMPKGKLAKKPA